AAPFPAREVHVVSDLQRTALGPGRADVPRGVRVVALAPASQAAANRGVGVVRVTDGAVVVGIVGTPGAESVGGAAAVTLRVRGEGRPEVVIGDRPEAGAMVSIVVPPADPALVGQANRALAARGGRWRFATAGTPGPIAGPVLPTIAGLQVTRRYRIETVTGDAGRGTSADTTVLATVNREPWLVRDGAVLLLGSRLDTAWTALPAAPAFVPFLDALGNRVARSEAPISEAEGAPG